ncbi:MAG: aminopeptidase [Planctomycetota bacterium]|nr:MAG: aminopeptidase [Planctomycetota bacterium]
MNRPTVRISPGGTRRGNSAPAVRRVRSVSPPAWAVKTDFCLTALGDSLRIESPRTAGPTPPFWPSRPPHFARTSRLSRNRMSRHIRTASRAGATSWGHAAIGFALLAATGAFLASRPQTARADDTAVATAKGSVAKDADAKDAAANNAALVEERLFSSVKYLASDELEGRGIGTKGLDAAAFFLAAEFTKLGLRTDAVEGTPFQNFKISLRTQLGPKESNRLAFVVPKGEADKTETVDLELGKSFTPLAVGGSAKFDLPLVFAGYGITAKDEGYDDYAGIDVKDKAVVILRHNPQVDQPGGLFTTGHGPSRHATFDTKISNAYQHGAALVILVNGSAEIEKQIAGHQRRWLESTDKLAAAHAEFKKIENPTSEQLAKHREETTKLSDEIKKYAQRWQDATDPLLEFERAGSDNNGRKIPVVFCTRAAADRVIKAALGKDLATIEREIDAGAPAAASVTGTEGGQKATSDASVSTPPVATEPAEAKPDDGNSKKLPKPTPRSAALGVCRAVGETAVTREDASVKNVIAVLDGEGPLADETVVIGAHYDHLGRGGSGSLARGSTDIHNGADDNASGTAALLEVARSLATEKNEGPRRRIVFMAFSAEERGLIGSAYYVNNPVFPLEKTVAMLNMDMVGRVSDNKLIVQGADTADEFKAWVEKANETALFKLTHQPGGFGPSDHASFYPKRIPVMHFFTGLHSDYHRPSDDYDKVDVAGMRKVVEMVTYVATQVAEKPERPTFREGKQPAPRRGGGDRPYFGSIPDFGEPVDGLKISGVTKDGPAAKGGLQGGDIITMLGDNKIGNLEDFDAALRKFKAGDKISVAVKRKDEALKLEVTVEEPR